MMYRIAPRFKHLHWQLFALALGLFAQVANAETFKFVYTYLPNGNLVTPNNRASECPNPSSSAIETTNCKGVKVAADGSYTLKLPSEALVDGKNLVISVHEYWYVSAAEASDGVAVYQLIEKRRRVDNITPDTTNSNVNVTLITEALTEALETNLQVSLGTEHPADNQTELLANIDSNKLNQALGETVNTADDDTTTAIVDINKDKLDPNAQAAIAELADIAVRNHEDDTALDYIEKSAEQGLVNLGAISDIIERVKSRLQDLHQADGSSPIMVLDADRYVATPGDTISFTTDQSLNASQFYGYSWTGVESDTAQAEWVPETKGKYAVCVSGETDYVKATSASLSSPKITIYQAGDLPPRTHLSAATQVTYAVETNFKKTKGSIKFGNATPGLGDNGEVAVDTFAIQVTGGGNSVDIVTKASTITASTTLVGAGSSTTDALGFNVHLVSINSGLYTFKVSSISNRHALSHIEFYFGKGANVTSPTSSYQTTRAPAVIADNNDDTPADETITDDEKKGHVPVSFCHATGSSKNPYVFITTDIEGVINGHKKHEGDVFGVTSEADCPSSNDDEHDDSDNDPVPDPVISGNWDTYTDCVRVTVEDKVLAVASANRYEAFIGDTLQLDGSASLGATSYAWSGEGTFSASTSAKGSWKTPQTPGTYALTLSINGGKSKATIIIKVYANMPSAQIQADKTTIYTLGNDTAAGLTSLSRTADGSAVDNLTWSILEQPAGASGKLSAASGVTTSFSSTTPGNYVVKLTATKGGYSDSATIALNVIQRNAPIADAGIDINTSKNTLIKLDGSKSRDPDGDPLTYSWTISSGTLTDANSVTPSFTTGTYGSYTATLTVSDGKLTSSDKVLINVANNAPTADNMSFTVPRDRMLSKAVRAADRDGDAISYSVSTKPLYGKLAFDPITGSFTYLPLIDPRNRCGGTTPASMAVDERVTASSVTTGKDVALLKISATKFTAAPNEVLSLSTVNSLNAAKLSNYEWVGAAGNGTSATFQSPYSGKHQVCVAATVTATNNIASHCVTIVVSGNTPSPESTCGLVDAVDIFEYRANDGLLNSNLAKVTITIGGPNKPPIPQNLVVSTDEDASVSSQVKAEDPEGDSYTFTALSQPAKGKLTFNSDGTFSFTPNANATGADSFTFKATDSLGAISTPATVNIIITPVNDAPTAKSGAITVAEDSSNNVGTLSGSDPEGSALSFKLSTAASQGTVVISNASTGAFAYTPKANYTGTDSFSFTVNDGSADSAPATVVVTVTPVNDAPLAANLDLTTAENTKLNAALKGTDVDGDVLTYTLVSQPTLGTITLNDAKSGSFTYTPKTETNGKDSFTYTVSDGKLTSSTATAAITITPVNDPPVATGISLSTKEDTAVNGTLKASDPENNSVTFTVASNPSSGQVKLNDAKTGGFTYTPNKDFNGSDSFTFTASDGNSSGTAATVLINVTPVNDPPIAVNGTLTTAVDETALASLSATDVDGDTLTYKLVKAPSKCSASISGNSVTLLPTGGQTGSDNFTFVANDGITDSNTATVAITLTAANQTPKAEALEITVFQDVTYTGALKGSDPESQPITYAIGSAGLLGSASVTDAATGAFTYTPKSGLVGTDFFTYYVNDGKRNSGTALVKVTILRTENVCGNDPNRVFDTDNDGFADIIEKAIGTLVNDASSRCSAAQLAAAKLNFADDDDGDGYSDAAEFWVGTDPNDSKSKPATTSTPMLPSCVGSGSDIIAPRLLGFNILTPTLDISGGTAKALYAVSSADNATGVAAITVKLTSPSSKATVAANTTVDPAQLIGAWELSSETFNQYAEAGTWTVSELSITDKAGNIAKWKTADLVALKKPTTIVITNPNADALAPGLTEFTILTPTLDITQGDAKPKCRYNAADQGPAGIKDAVIRIQSPTGSQFALLNDTWVGVGPREVEGSAFNAFAEIGIWQVTEFSLTDKAGNTKKYSNTDLKTLGYNTSITLTSTGGQTDTQAPWVSSFMVTTPQLDPSTGNAKSGYSLTANDTGAGVKRVTVTLTSPSGKETQLAEVSTPSPTNMLVARITSNAFAVNAELGVWRVTALRVEDGAGNITIHDEAAIKVLSSATTITLFSNIGSAPPTNTAPVAKSSSISTKQDVAVNGSVTATDANSDKLTFAITANGKLGTATLNSSTGGYTYTPKSGQSGTDTFYFTANDGKADSSPAAVTVTIIPADKPPVANTLSGSTTKNSPYQGTLTGSDSLSRALSYSIVDQPNSGSVTLNSGTGQFTYTPASNFAGNASFTFKVNNGVQDSTKSTVTIAVKELFSGFNILTPVIYIAAPLKISYEVSLVSDVSTMRDIDVTLVSPSGRVLTSSAAALPGKNTVSTTLDPATSNFPEAGTFTVSKLRLVTNDGAVTLYTTADLASGGFPTTLTMRKNNAPVAKAGSLTTDEGVTALSTLLATDADSDALTYKIVNDGTLGTATLNDAKTGVFTYVPNAGESGTDTVTFVANDGRVDSSPGTITVTIKPVNDVPVAYSAAITTAENIAYSGKLSGSDPDSSALTFKIVSQGNLGVATLSSSSTGAFIYTPNKNTFGKDTFTFTVSDGQTTSAVGTITVTITEVNVAPTANALSISTLESTAYLGKVSGADKDGDTLSYSIATQPSQGSASITNAATGAFTYTPNAGAVGSDTFTFSVSDGKLTATGTVSVIIESRAAACVGPATNGMDSDGDGYADVIERAFGTAANNAGASPVGLSAEDLGISFTDDDDKDGVKDYIEIWLGTNPNDASSKPTDTDGNGLPDCFNPLSDGIKPQLIGFKIATPTVDASPGNAKFRFALSLADNASGVRRIRVSLLSPSSVLVTTALSFDKLPVVVGTELESQQLSAFAEQGTWTIANIQIYDNAGNKLTYVNAELKAMGLKTDISVTNLQGDAAPPVLNSFTVKNGTVNPAAGNVKIGFSVSATDTGSGVAQARLDMMSPSGVVLSNVLILDQVNTSSTFDLETPTLSVYAEAGTWNIIGMQLFDAAGNSAQYLNELKDKGLPTSVIVTNTQGDNTPPTLVTLSILTPSVTPTNGDKRASFGIVATDDKSGLESIRVDLMGPSGQYITAWANFYGTYPTSTTAQVDTPLLNKLTELGTWTIDGIEIVDEAGNVLFLSQDELKAKGISTTLEMVYQ